MLNLSDEYTFTTSQAAEILEVSERTVRRRCNNGDLDAIKKNVNGIEQWFINQGEFSQIAQAIEEVIEVANVKEPINLSDLKRAFQQALEVNNQELKEVVLQQNQVLAHKLINMEEELKIELNKINSTQISHFNQVEKRDRELMLKIRELQEKKDKPLLKRLKEVFS